MVAILFQNIKAFGTLAVTCLAFSALAQNCVLTVPPNPLTAIGLATPYTVTGCNQVDFGNQGSFVEAAIFDPATSQITVYHPLVVNEGAVEGTDFIKPIPAIVPAGATVGIWFGSNALTLTLAGATQGCVNGLANSVFGQFAYCNGDVFMQTVIGAATSGKLQVPPPGRAVDGSQCPTSRDFRVVDMDQSDNLDTTYLLIGNKMLAQNTPANKKANPNAEELTNGSDNSLINDFIAPAIGCTPFTVSSITAPTGKTGSMATNELQAQLFPPPGGPALVPVNDDFAFINNNGKITFSLQKTNLYRAGVGQPQAQTIANASATPYCKSFAQSGVFIASNMGHFTNQPSPAPTVANNLYTFLAQRFSAAFGPAPALGCTTIFGINNPVTLTMDGNGVVTQATINSGMCTAILNGVVKPVASGGAQTTGGTTGNMANTGNVGNAGSLATGGKTIPGTSSANSNASPVTQGSIPTSAALGKQTAVPNSPTTLVTMSRTATAGTKTAAPVAQHFQQCGGRNFNGPSLCASPFTCKVMNPFYSQCV